MTCACPASRRAVAGVLLVAASFALPPSSISEAMGRDDVAEARVRAHMEFLASDALNGRRSGSRDEWIAATYAASQLRAYGLRPLGDDGSFVRVVDLPAPPVNTRGANPDTLPADSIPPASRMPAPSVGAPSAAEPPSASQPARAAARQTWNVYGEIPGSDVTRRREVILLSAHLDHVGQRGTEGDTIYNGADDDASGVTAVLELARLLSEGDRPRRTVMVVLFGSEETGGFGARDFLAHPPVSLERVVANLEFEMIGRPDPLIPKRSVWLTGFDRTDLGPMLARHGGRVVADPRPAERFFERSDNITLARRGIVAQTVSTFGLHTDYHRPSDDLEHIDFAHLTQVINDLAKPIRWLARTAYKPAWLPGKQPSAGR